tara:strand:- start:11511 stop:13298 length:1788 start_codon:yes stop_codon:yes gene_type:complete
VATFSIGETDFELDGAPFRVLAGSIHYFRVHPELWRERIRQARAMGLNTIETYVAWNAHEARRGEWVDTGHVDLARFLDVVAEEGMFAIVRPGPYICAEWHNGGLPVWLTSMPDIGLRRSEPRYLAEVTRYLSHVYETVAPRQISRGGPVIMVQIENEYGAYGNDKEYLAELVRLTRESGIDAVLTTVDQPTDQMLSDGSLPGIHLTGSFGSRAAERLATLREHQPTGPLMCAEFWDGWFDWWGSYHHTTSAADAAAELDTLLAAGASVTFYMFHGGTNFGLTNGANDKGRYLPTLTSYDYDAPLSEAGEPTEKYFAFRDVIGRYAPIPASDGSNAPQAPAAVAAPSVECELRNLGDWRTLNAREGVRAENPLSFDELEHLSAIVRYETTIPDSAFADAGHAVLDLGEVRDRAWVEVDGIAVGILSRMLHESRISIPRGSQLSVLVEDQGRVNYAGRLGEAKGLIGDVYLAGERLTDWVATPIDIADLGAQLSEGPQSGDTVRGAIAGPVALRGEFTVDEPTTLFLDTAEWGKGYAFINGFFLGRYWRSGPQRTLFVPAPVVRSGANTVVVLELESVASATARFVSHALLGQVDE